MITCFQIFYSYFPMASDIIINMANHVLCLAIGRVRLVFGCPEVKPGMEEAQSEGTGRLTTKLKLRSA